MENGTTSRFYTKLGVCDGQEVGLGDGPGRHAGAHGRLVLQGGLVQPRSGGRLLLPQPGQQLEQRAIYPHHHRQQQYKLTGFTLEIQCYLTHVNSLAKV